MGWLESIRGKLNETNEAFADAHKAWKDDQLDGREAAIESREASVAAREAAVRKLQEKMRKAESQWFRRKIGFGVVALATAIPSFLIGGAMSTMTKHEQGESSKITPDTSPIPSTAPTSPAVTDEQSELGHDEIETVTTSSEFNTISDPIASCTKRGIAYFMEIGSYPVLHSAPDTGRTAEDVAYERCTRTITAF